MLRNLKKSLSLGVVLLASPLLSFGQQADSAHKALHSDTLFVVQEADLVRSLQLLVNQLSAQPEPAQQTQSDLLQLLLKYRMLLPAQDPAPAVYSYQNNSADAELLHRLNRIEDLLARGLYQTRPATSTKTITSTKNNSRRPNVVVYPGTEETKQNLPNEIRLNASLPQAQVIRDTIYRPLQERITYQNPDNSAELSALRAEVQMLRDNLNRLSLQQPSNTTTYITNPAPVVEAQKIDFQRQVFFAVGKSELTPAARLALDELVGVLKAVPTARVQLTSYASPEGSVSLNERLVANRLSAVAGYLTTRGISNERLRTELGGLDKAEPKTLARRVDAVLLQD